MSEGCSVNLGKDLSLSSRNAYTQSALTSNAVQQSSAVPIPTPGQASQPTVMKAATGNFRPLNTLTRPNGLGQQNSKRQKQDFLSGIGSSQGLQLEASRGNNVQLLPAMVLGDDEYEVPLAKRQKRESKTSRLDEVQMSSDGLDPICMDDETVMSLSRECKRPNEIRSSQSRFVGSSHLHANGQVKEFRNVESRMKSNPPKINRLTYEMGHAPANGSGSSDASSLQEAGASSRSNPINLSDDDVYHEGDHRRSPSTKPKWDIRISKTEIGRVRNEAAYWHQPRDTGEQSPHFKKDHSTEKHEDAPHTRSAVDLPDIDIQDEEPRLNDQFRTTEGRRRNTEYSSSTDELAMSPDAGSHRVQIIRKTMRTKRVPRSVSPAKSCSTRKGSPCKEELGGLAPSSLPLSTFKRSATKDVKPNASTRQSKALAECEAQWGIQLAAVIVRGQLLSSPNLGLQHNPRTNTYEVISGGQILSMEDASLQVKPQKLQKAYWSESGVKIRLSSSKSGNFDHVLDLELCNEKDCQRLLTRLQEESASMQVVTKERDFLDKAFMQRISQQEKQSALSSSRAIDQDEDLRLAARNKANRDPTYGGPETEDLAGQKRRRLYRMADKMKAGREATLTPRSKLSSLSGLRRNAPGYESDSGFGVSPPKISEITRGLLPRMQNSGLATAPTVMHLDTRGPLSSLSRTRDDRVPQLVGLGEPWRKPLIYPKDGKKKATVEWTDLERLGEGEFFNDTLISFYLRYLEHQYENRKHGLAGKVHFFNSFFYASLTKTQRGKKGINYEAVKRWASRGGMDLFTYDFVIVPINESLHWYLAVICNLPALKRNLGQLGDDFSIAPPPAPKGDMKKHPATLQASSSTESTSAGAAREVAMVRDPNLDTERSTEEDTRSSFAGLSLDQEDKNHQDILGAQIRINVSGDAKTLKGPSENLATTRNGIAPVDAVSEPESPKATSVSKKRKRKSMASGKKLDPTEPAIITFDSLAVAHPLTVRVLKDYLKAEAQDKRTMAFDDSQIKGMTAVGIPKQDNYCDCGPYLLGYIEKFLEDPKDFMVKVMQKTLDADKDWPRLDPIKMRSNIRDLIMSLHGQQEDERKANAKKGNITRPSQKLESGPSREPHSVKETNAQPVEHMRTSLTPIVQAEPIPNTTKSKALETALRVDETAKAAIMHPSHLSHNNLDHAASSQEKGQPEVIVDSQPVETEPPVQPADNTLVDDFQAEESSITLPSTIPDSQPEEAFQSLEEAACESHDLTPPQPQTETSGAVSTIPAQSRVAVPPCTDLKSKERDRQKAKADAKDSVIVKID